MHILLTSAHEPDPIETNSQRVANPSGQPVCWLNTVERILEQLTVKAQEPLFTTRLSVVT